MLLCVCCRIAPAWTQEFVSPLDLIPIVERALDDFGQVQLIPERPPGAGLQASFLSVLTWSPALDGIRDGATTVQRTLSWARRRAIHMSPGRERGPWAHSSVRVEGNGSVCA